MRTDRFAQSHRERAIIIGVILTSIPLSGMGIDIYVPALPVIHQLFHTSHLLTKSTITVYLLGFALAQLIVGPLSDCYGRKHTLMIGLLGFALTSLLAAVTSSITFFLTMRFLQGTFVATPVVMAKAITADAFQGNALKKVSTYLVTAWSLGPILAPTIGAHLQTWINWRASFYFLALYTLLLLSVIAIALPETHIERPALNFNQIIHHYQKTLFHPKFLGMAICLGVSYAMIIVFNVLGPFLIQESLGYSPLQFGRFAALLGVTCFAGSLINRLITVAFPQKKIILWGNHCTMIISLLMLAAAMYHYFNLYTLFATLFPILLLVGIIFPNCSAICLSLFPQIAGVASASMGLINILFVFSASFVVSSFHIETMFGLAWIYLGLSGLFYLFFLYSIKLVREENRVSTEHY